MRVTWPCLDERWRLVDVLAPHTLDERAVYVRSRHIVHDDTNLLTSRSAREPVPVRPGQPRAKPPRAGRCESERRLHALAPSQFWRMCFTSVVFPAPRNPVSTTHGTGPLAAAFAARAPTLTRSARPSSKCTMASHRSPDTLGSGHLWNSESPLRGNFRLSRVTNVPRHGRGCFSV